METLFCYNISFFLTLSERHNIYSNSDREIKKISWAYNFLLINVKIARKTSN